MCSAVRLLSRSPVTLSRWGIFSATDVTLAAGGKDFAQPLMFRLVTCDLATDPVVNYD